MRSLKVKERNRDLDHREFSLPLLTSFVPLPLGEALGICQRISGLEPGALATGYQLSPIPQSLGRNRLRKLSLGSGP